MKLVAIDWVDSIQPTSEWQYLSEYKPESPINCTSVGFLVCDNKQVKAVAQNIGNMNKEGHRQASGIIHIPTRSVTKIKEIKL